jgi:DNA-binding response OmpR family regulator
LKDEKEVTPRVLVVDDDPDTRVIVSSAVTVLDFEAVQAEDAAQALEICQEKGLPDLAVLDVMMPGMDGNELCRTIRELEGGESVAILMLTARDSIEDKVLSLQGGADDYQTKPFHFRELQARLQALWRIRQLYVYLQEKNLQLQEMQDRLIEQERKLAVLQLAGTAAHELGQPISAIMLNCHVLETLPKEDERFNRALTAVKQDVRRLADMIEKLKKVDAAKKKEYFAGTDILDLGDD